MATTDKPLNYNSAHLASTSRPNREPENPSEHLLRMVIFRLDAAWVRTICTRACVRACVWGKWVGG